MGYRNHMDSDEPNIHSYPARLLVVDDEESVAVTIGEVLRMESFQVDIAFSGQEALSRLQETQYDLVLTDLHMEATNGLSVLTELRRSSPHTIALVLTGFASLESAIAAMRHGAYDYLIKPCVIEDLKLTIQRGLEHRSLMLAERDARANLERLNRELEQRVEERTRELQRVNEDLERASRAKDVFFATLSHELRTPLTPILGWSRLLRRGSVEPALLDQGLDAIERGARLQARLIDDLLDISRIVSGKLHLTLEPIDLRMVVEAALETVRERAEAAEVRLTVRMPKHPVVVQGEPLRMQQIVWNLLSNAIKFTPEGGQVSVELKRNRDEAHVIVSDTGQGIEPHFLPNVFSPFSQADILNARRHGGLGLGLAIVSKLTEMHLGTVRAESDGIGKGSRFSVTFPCTKIEGVHSSKEIVTDIVNPPGTVLIVDDSQDTLEMIRVFFRSLGWRTLAAGSAEEALKMAKDERPSIIVSDIGMPEADGYEMIATVRETPGLEDVPAIALSGYAMEEDLSRALESGFDAHMAKPVDPDELFALVCKLVQRSTR